MPFMGSGTLPSTLKRDNHLISVWPLSMPTADKTVSRWPVPSCLAVGAIGLYDRNGTSGQHLEWFSHAFLSISFARHGAYRTERRQVLATASAACCDPDEICWDLQKGYFVFLA